MEERAEYDPLPEALTAHIRDIAWARTPPDVELAAERLAAALRREMDRRVEAFTQRWLAAWRQQAQSAVPDLPPPC